MNQVILNQIEGSSSRDFQCLYHLTSISLLYHLLEGKNDAQNIASLDDFASLGSGAATENEVPFGCNRTKCDERSELLARSRREFDEVNRS